MLTVTGREPHLEYHFFLKMAFYPKKKVTQQKHQPAKHQGIPTGWIWTCSDFVASQHFIVQKKSPPATPPKTNAERQAPQKTPRGENGSCRLFGPRVIYILYNHWFPLGIFRMPSQQFQKTSWATKKTAEFICHLKKIVDEKTKKKTRPVNDLKWSKFN